VTTLVVFVPGHPAPQGSKRHVGNGVMIESSKRVKSWREDVRAALLDPTGQPRHRFDAEAALTVRLEFVMPRPASTPKRRTPPAIRKPDIDKLARALLDAITSAGVISDDARVVDLHATKRLAEIGEATGCRITVLAASGAAVDQPSTTALPPSVHAQPPRKVPR
jgi:crossover junction endodeoxyribonuclease RusA